MEKLETGYSLEEHVEGAPRHLGASLLRLDLAQEAADVRAEVQRQKNGYHSKTLVKYGDLRVVLMAFQAGARLREHKAPGEITLQVISGEIVFTLPEQTVTVRQGGLLTLEQPLPHGVEAVQDSIVLLTLSWTRKPA